MVGTSVLQSIRRAAPVVAVATVSSFIALISLIPPVLSIRTDSRAPGFATGDWFIADLGTGLPLALIAALVALVAGVLVVVDGRSFGHGLVVGAGLAVIGWSMLALGLVQIPVGEVYDALAVPVADPYTVTITRRFGFGLLVVDVIAGLAVVAVSITHLGRHRSAPLDPWVAAVGAVGVVLAVIGLALPLTEDLDNGSPMLYLVGRGIQLLLVLVGGVVGFLLVSRVGLGLVAGSLSVAVASALVSIFGGDPTGPTGGSMGAVRSPLLANIGLGIAICALVTALVIARRRSGFSALAADLADEQVRWSRSGRRATPPNDR